MCYKLAEAEVKALGYPDAWSGLMIETQMKSMETLTDKEVKEYYEAVFGL